MGIQFFKIKGHISSLGLKINDKSLHATIYVGIIPTTITFYFLMMVNLSDSTIAKKCVCCTPLFLSEVSTVQ